jgi:tetratricopeptide (TPR) repeat protein
MAAIVSPIVFGGKPSLRQTARVEQLPLAGVPLLERILGGRAEPPSEGKLAKRLAEILNSRKGKALVLMLDAYELLVERGLDPEVQSEFLSILQPPILIVLSGRRDLIVEGQLQPRVSARPISMSLGQLSKSEAQEYIQQVHPVHTPELLELTVEISEGIPLALRIATSELDRYRSEDEALSAHKARSGFGTRAYVVENLTTEWFRGLSKEIALSTKAACILHEFHYDNLSYVLDRDKATVELPEMSWRVDGPTGWIIHEEVRRVIREWVRYSERDEFLRQNERAAEYYRGCIEGQKQQSDPRRFQDDGWRRNVVEWIYHLVQYDEKKGIGILLEEVADAIWNMEWATCLSILDSLAELSYFGRESWLVRLREAIDAAEHQERDKAIAAFEALLGAEPLTGRDRLRQIAHDALAYYYQALNKWKDARVHLVQAADYFEQHKEAYKLAMAQEQLADCAQAMEDTEAQRKWAQCAIENYRRAADEGPYHQAGAWEHMGNLYRNHVKDLDQAIAAYERSYQADSSRWSALNSAAKAYEAFAKWREATAAYERLAEAEPNWRSAALTAAARCLGKAGETAEAEARFQTLLKEKHPRM